jgi:type II secretory ATPase GspE/PulE/Tfp pilus assembly ATPase PilB-like protein
MMLWSGKGCDSCGGSGYRGRVALHELLVNDDDIKKSIAHKGSIDEIRRLAQKGGMSTLLQDGIEKAAAGLTDLKQVMAVCSR